MITDFLSKAPEIPGVRQIKLQNANETALNLERRKSYSTERTQFLPFVLFWGTQADASASEFVARGVHVAGLKC
jgi:hypothetical protein